MVVSETYSCLLRLKSLTEEGAVKMQPGSGESHLLYVKYFLAFGFQSILIFFVFIVPFSYLTRCFAFILQD